MTVQAPYHFVPLSKWVYMPDWAHLVSHDVPFEDGVSGVIEYTLTNHTPLCVGDTKDENGVLKFARNPSGELVIPSSSLKGMIRSVLEIASFGKFASVDNKHFSYRDFRDEHYKNWADDNKEHQAGWIKYDVDKRVWTFRKAKHTILFLDEFRGLNSVTGDISTSRHGSIGAENYQTFPLTNTFRFNEKVRTFSYNHQDAKSQEVSRAQLDNDGKLVGHAIFSSFRPTIYPMSSRARNRKLSKRILQANTQDLNTCSKRTEFSYVFYDIQDPFAPPGFGDAVSALFTSHEVRQVDLMRKHAHPEYGIPVFAKVTGQKVSTLGFAKLPKIKYTNAIHDIIKSVSEAHISPSYFDMAELMFGTLRDQELSLKSRVYFSDAVNGNKPQTYPSKRLVLSEPKATFYPAYLEQPDRGKLLNYNDSATPSGAKRYISKAPQYDDLAAYSESNQEISQSFELCPTGESFSGKIIFHNLKQIELSALLWCLKLKDSYHQLGHGKPFGAGTVKINAQLTHWRTNCDEYTIENNLETQFETTMEKHYPSSQENSWKSSPQLTYLLELGKLEQNNGTNTSYMPLDDFQAAKNNKRSLPNFKSHPRTEPSISPTPEVSLSFGQGRLSRLFNEGSSFEKKQLDHVNAKFDEIKMKQKRDAMTEHELHFHDLLADFEDIDPTEKPPRLRKAIYFYIENIDSSARDFALQLHQIANENDFRKKPKKRVEEHKEILVKLNELYKLNL